MIINRSIDTILDNISESRFEKGRGSALGREKSTKDKKKFNPEKSKVRVYPSIKKALQHGKYGDVFSSDTADRLYVVTKPTWGDKSTQGGNKVAKGFTPGAATPKATWGSIKAYANRTKKKHAGSTSKTEGYTTGGNALATGVRVGSAKSKKHIGDRLKQSARIHNKVVGKKRRGIYDREDLSRDYDRGEHSADAVRRLKKEGRTTGANPYATMKRVQKAQGSYKKGFWDSEDQKGRIIQKMINKSISPDKPKKKSKEN